MYKTYKFASVPFGANFEFDYTLKKNKDYETSDAPLFTVSVNSDDIELERKLYLETGEVDNGKLEPLLEHTAIYRKFVEKAIDYGIVLFHGSAIEYKGRAYLFVAPSGTGKSTHTKLAKEVFKNEVRYINDDKPLISVEKDGCYVYGSPYDGKHKLSNNIKVKLGAICLLSRGENNQIKRLDKKASALKFLSFSYRPKDENTSKLYFNHLEKILDYPIYALRCNIKPDAPKLSLETMSKNYE